jgi:hypothetical protein
MEKPKRSISDSEFYMIASFLSSKKEEFAFYCDGFDYYDDEDIDNLIEEVAGPEYKEFLNKF